MRRQRVRARARGTADRPRLSIFRSNTRLYVQFIDDAAGKTLAAVLEKKGVFAVAMLGKKCAEAARAAGITRAVFDRGAYRYHGAIKAVAEGARESGLIL
mgnify:CR=1 FL=1